MTSPLVSSVVIGLFVATCAAYGVASALFVARLAGWSRLSRAASHAPALVLAGVLLHAAHVVVASSVLRVCPVEGMHFAMSVLSICACVAYLVARRWYAIDVVGVFVAPLALTFLVASQAVAGGVAGPRVRGAILPLHVAVLMLGYGLFVLAFGAAVAYLVQENRLKRKQLTGLFQRLPSLEALDSAEHGFLLAGFPLLTIGVITGALWAQRAETFASVHSARALFGYATWALFAGVLLLRAAAGWRGRRAAYGTIAGFGFAIVVLLLYVLRAGGSA